MKKFIFTFRSDHPFKNHFQPVYAKDRHQARLKMIEKYGDGFLSQYREKEFIELEKQMEEIGVPLKIELSPIYCKGVDKQ